MCCRREMSASDCVIMHAQAVRGNPRDLSDSISLSHFTLPHMTCIALEPLMLDLAL